MDIILKHIVEQDGGLNGYAGSYHPSCGSYSTSGATQTSGGTGYYQRGGFGYGGAQRKIY
ncbi:MAG: hypothetical protein HFJ51_01795 [Clostridia bacterium]|nr:hypothetical protein [Clostridia bacterium]